MSKGDIVVPEEITWETPLCDIPLLEIPYRVLRPEDYLGEKADYKAAVEELHELRFHYDEGVHLRHEKLLSLRKAYRKARSESDRAKCEEILREIKHTRGVWYGDLYMSRRPVLGDIHKESWKVPISRALTFLIGYVTMTCTAAALACAFPLPDSDEEPKPTQS